MTGKRTKNKELLKKRRRRKEKAWWLCRLGETDAAVGSQGHSNPTVGGNGINTTQYGARGLAIDLTSATY